MATGDGVQNRKEVSRFDLVSTMEEEGSQLLLHGDGDGMQNRKKVGVADGHSDGNAVQVIVNKKRCRWFMLYILLRRTNQGRKVEMGAAVAIVIFKE